MSEVLFTTLLFVFLMVAVFTVLKSLQRLSAMRREGREIKDFYDNELAREIKDAILGEISKKKPSPEGPSGKPKPSDALAGLLMEMYDDLYARISDEEATRKKTLDELREEIERLKSEIKNKSA